MDIIYDFINCNSMIYKFHHMIVSFENIIFFKVFRVGPIIESKKLPIYGSLVEPMLEPQSNRWHHKYIIYILLKLKIIIKILKYI